MQKKKNSRPTRIEVKQEVKQWLETQYEGYTVCFGIPVYKTIKAATLASAIGYRDNRGAVLTEPHISIYIMGRFMPIKLGAAFVFPS